MIRRGYAFLGPALLLFASATSPASAATVEDQDLEGFEEGSVPPLWKAGGIPDGLPHGATLRIVSRDGRGGEGSRALAFRYPLKNRPVPVLVHYVPLASMTSVAFWIRAPEATTWVTAVKDLDGAVFNAPAALPANRWKRVVLRPGDFRLNDDSPVKKERLDPERLGRGYVGFDLEAVLGGGGSREILVDDVAVTRGALETIPSGLVVEGERAIEAPTRVEGDLVVRDGGSLRVTAGRFEVMGDVRVEGGELSLAGGRWRIPQAYRYQRTIAVTKGGAFSLSSGTLDVDFPVSSHLGEGSSLRVDGVSMSGGHFTLGVQKGCAVRFENAKGLGEFIVQRGASFEVSECDSILVWLQCMKGDAATLKLPGETVKIWRAPEGLGRDLTVRDSTGMRFGLLAGEGCDLTFEDSALFAAGILFLEGGPWKVEGLKNGTVYDDFTFDNAGLNLRLKNSSVRAWNFYAMTFATLEIRDCVFGESLSFHQARIEVVDSVCDGKGGYLGARDQSTTKVKGGRIACEVLAHDDATIELRDTRVEGDVKATRDGRVLLSGAEVLGDLVELERGRIEREGK